MAWPRPSGSFWRTYETEAISEIGGVEVVLDRALVPAGHEDDLLEPGGDRLLHYVLNGGLVHERQHLLGLGLRGGQEPGAEPRGREDGLAHCHRAS